jgi:excisionase family DNA binding protein
VTKYYTTSEVANICNVHRNTIIGAIRKGLLKIHRTPGGHARISQEDLDDFCHRRSLPTTSVIARNNRVLILDADAKFVSVLTRGLNELEYQVEAAREPFRAGYLLGRFQPNVVLVETSIGETSGESICQTIRSMSKLRDLAIIAISQDDRQETVDSLVDAGVDDFLAKPFELEELVSRIERLIGPVVQGTSGRATTGKITGKITDKVTRIIQSDDVKDDEDDDTDLRATRRSKRRGTGSRTTFGGVLAGKEDSEDDYTDR